MIVDADPAGNSCHKANFVVGGTTSMYLHLVCFISNCVIEQPVDAFQSLMVVAYRLLIFRKKILMVVAYF